MSQTDTNTSTSTASAPAQADESGQAAQASSARPGAEDLRPQPTRPDGTSLVETAPDGPVLVATEPLFIGRARAHNTGDVVPAANVAKHGWEDLVEEQAAPQTDQDDAPPAATEARPATSQPDAQANTPAAAPVGTPSAGQETTASKTGVPGGGEGRPKPPKSDQHP